MILFQKKCYKEEREIKYWVESKYSKFMFFFSPHYVWLIFVKFFLALLSFSSSGLCKVSGCYKIPFSLINLYYLLFVCEEVLENLPQIKMCCRHSFHLHELEVTSIFSYYSMIWNSARNILHLSVRLYSVQLHRIQAAVSLQKLLRMV